MKSCRDCDQLVSIEAKNCPNCGAPKPTKAKKKGCLYYIGIFFAFSLVVGVLQDLSEEGVDGPPSAGGVNEGPPSAGESVRCESPSRRLLNNIASGLEVSGGGTIGRGGAVRSGAHSNGYFVAAEIQGAGMDDQVAVWFTNRLDGSGMLFSVDNMAQEFSVFPDAGRTVAEATMSDPGARESRTCVQ